MIVVSNDPSLWPTINNSRQTSYANGSCRISSITQYLTMGSQLHTWLWWYTIWRQRWSLMTILYLGARYSGIPYIVYVRKAKEMEIC
ncbi:hypothetical protein K503DRAFT_778062 [Rhizopogon vinicolor AM-OR11-026]|uniref:Uncharacterized protein n=1 Tax=Rhizopogon vinicolor AM-OR11-026 TaxID=1314800 RepID=A0A1B7MDN5_9AGAM|nr:hypothetical protein K503DRAFT_778062 [Rhizopogon vinicolor AM-OR11-026]